MSGGILDPNPYIDPMGNAAYGEGILSPRQAPTYEGILSPSPGFLSRLAHAVATMPSVVAIKENIEKPGKVLRGEARVPATYGPSADPAMADEAIGWGLGNAVLPSAAMSLGPAMSGPVFGAGSIRAFHGSPTHGLAELRPSERGPLGPGVYMSPSDYVANRYAGPEGKLYEKSLSEDDIFQGIKSRDSDVNPYQVWRDQKARLVEAAEPEKKQAVADLMDRMSPDDGYPFYARLRNLYGSDEGAQKLLKKAGYKGLSGTVDGPEIVLFERVTF